MVTAFFFVGKRHKILNLTLSCRELYHLIVLTTPMYFAGEWLHVFFGALLVDSGFVSRENTFLKEIK